MTADRNDYISGIDKTLIDEALEWRALMDDDVVDSDKRAAFHAWVMSDPSHMQAFDYAERFWEQLKSVSDPDGSRTPFIRDANEARASSLRRRTAFFGAAVALIIVALVIPSTLRQGPTSVADTPLSVTYQTAIAESRTLELVDGSRVVLGPDSRIETRIGDDQRMVTLFGGEAYFDVEEDKDRPFSVVTATASISVVGTQFDVRTGNEKTHVAVADGRVQVGFAGADPTVTAEESIALKPGQKVIVEQSGIGEISVVSTELIGAWRDNRLAFFNEPLSGVVDQVNRYDRREIVLADGDLAMLTVSATLDASDVDALLQTLAEIYPLVISERGDDRIVITRKK